jgi:putative multicomponent Na+:H+ antiporter subunit B
MTEWIDLVIVALLPLTALFTVLQKAPYAALVSRGIMGGIAVLLYTALGAADVALTEALVGTLLTVILYAVTVRSTLILRLGVLTSQPATADDSPAKRFCAKHKLALKTMPYESDKELRRALSDGYVDVVLIETDRLPALMRKPPENISKTLPVAVLAKHGRWHQRKMKEQFADELTVLRISPASPEGVV